MMLLVALGALACFAAPPHRQTIDGTFDSKGVPIRYVSAGEGEPVVLIHGWQSDSSMWGKDATGETLLSTKGLDGFRLIALDCRGHGKSGKPHDPRKYDSEMAMDVVRLLDHLKLDRAHLIGYSSGAFVAGKVAAMRPNRVRSLVFAGQAPIVGEVKEADFSETELFARIVEEGRDRGEYLHAVAPPSYRLTLDQAKFFAKATFRGKDVKALALAGRGYPKLSVKADDLKKCTAPILFIHGANESEHVKQKVATVRQTLGRGELVVVPGGDHMTTLAKPEFGASIVAFLKANRLK